MRRLTVVCGLVLCLSLALVGCASLDRAGDHRLHASYSRDFDLAYRVYLPEGYTRKDQRWPLILFLHGAEK